MFSSAIASLLLLLAGAGGELPRIDVWRVAPHRGGGGRVLFAADPVLARIGEDPDYEPDFLNEVRRDAKGVVAHRDLASGWAYCELRSDSERTVLVEGRGFHSLLLNGARFAGDFYRHGILRIPVPLRKGTNRLLVRAIRGSFSIRLLPAEGDLGLSPRDPTLPDLRRGELILSPGAVVVLNHTREVLDDAVLEVGDGRVFERVAVPVGRILPCSIAKPAFPLLQLRAPEPGELDEKGRFSLHVSLRRGPETHRAVYPLAVRGPGDAYVETRISDIDGSVQLHAVRPPLQVTPGRRYALFLSTHGAGVRALNQARAYHAKRDAYIVAPTNRRRYGFDWQDWGRLDALEALDFALRRYPLDRSRVYLTGHSMGGHGAWYLGVLYPSRFAAVAPSAGWASFYTYGGGMDRRFPDEPRLRAFTWTLAENAVLDLIRNLTHTPIYILHGERDDNVPVEEARRFAKILSGFHRDFRYHEQPGVKHWWGNECVDWIPLFEFCRHHRRVAAPLRFTFRTFNPAVTSRYAWAEIIQRESPAATSAIEVSADPRRGTVDVKTENVARLRLDLEKVMPGAEAKVAVDGAPLAVPGDRPVTFLHTGGSWSGFAGAARLTAEKNPRRGGPFKLAFAKRMVWVYGTSGTPEENRAVLWKVRYDAQVWWYRGNGNVEIVPDREFDPARYPDRNVILYGNADVNRAFAALLPRCPVSIRRDSVRIGDRAFSGDLGLFLVYPRPGTETNLVGVVGATTAKMMRMAQQCRYFISGSACPDWVVYTPETLTDGMGGVAASGDFTNRWQLR